MPFPADIQAEVLALNTAITAAMPLESAPQRTMAALATQADMLVTDVDTALTIAAGDLDTYGAPTMPPAMVLAFLNAVDEATTQVSLADLAGVAGRVASNLTNG